MDEKLYEMLTEIKVDIAEIRQAIKSKEETLEEHEEKLKKVCETIDGNGRIGLKTQVYILWGAFIILGSILLKEIFQ